MTESEKFLIVYIRNIDKGNGQVSSITLNKVLTINAMKFDIYSSLNLDISEIKECLYERDYGVIEEITILNIINLNPRKL